MSITCDFVTIRYGCINEYSKLICFHIHSFFRTRRAYSPTYCSTLWYFDLDIIKVLFSCFISIYAKCIPSYLLTQIVLGNSGLDVQAYEASGIWYFKIPLFKNLWVSIFLMYWSKMSLSNVSWQYSIHTNGFLHLLEYLYCYLLAKCDIAL